MTTDELEPTMNRTSKLKSKYWWLVQTFGLAGYLLLCMIDWKAMAGVFLVNVFIRLNGEFV